ncbi:MAG: SPOR domain-containing protein [Mucispirillum sp.]|nr:SPOR domain-containing protein [Mucispirillum sp.]
MAEDNKNSFRDMLLIIFVVLICFGITIYGIAYLTGKVFSSSPEPEITANERPKEITTNPQEGDTLTFTSMGESADEVMPHEDNIRTTVTPPKQDNAETAALYQNNTAPIPAPVLQEEKPAQAVSEPVKPQEDKKIKETAKPKEQTQPKPAPKKEEPAKETVKTSPAAQTGAFVVQLLAVQSRDAAEKEAAKYRSKYPDVFIKQVVIDGKTWYRVRLGVSTTKEQAQQKANKIASEFKIKPIVTKNN